MNTLPHNAKLYLLTIWGIAVGLLIFIVLWYPAYQSPLLLLLWLGLFVLADYYEAHFTLSEYNQLIMTVADAAMIFLAIIAGLSGAVIVVLGTGIVGILRQHTWYKNNFNMAQRAINYAAMVVVYTTVRTFVPIPFSDLVAFIAIALCDYILNALFVTTAIALAADQSIPQVYHESYHPIRWIQLVTLPFGAILAILWAVNPWLLALGVLPLVLAQRAFKAVAAWQAMQKAELEAQKAELAAVNTKLSQTQQARLAAVLSETHAANNHLSAIQTATERLLQRLGDGFAQDGERIRTAIAAMGTLIDDMQALALLQRDQLVLRRREADLIAVIADAAQRVEIAYRQQHAQLRLSILSEDFLGVMCDPPRLVQVFQHLLDLARDAVKSCPIGTVTAELSASATHAIVYIVDNGIGLSAEDLTALQTQIVQVTNGEVLLAEPEFGLLSCARLIALHNGSLVVASPGVKQGTSVTIALPRLCTPSSAPTPLLPADSQAPLRILIVDDDTTVTGSLVRLLHQRGYDVVAASDGRHGLMSYQTRRFDVVICDALMPDLNGPAFVRALRAYDSQAVILALSGQTGAGHVEEMLQAGACEALGKPCLIEELIAAIARIRQNDSSYGSAYGTGH